MTKIIPAIVLSCALTAAALPAAAKPNAGQEARLAKALAGRTAGDAVSCIRQHDIDSVDVFDDTALLYRMRGGDFYLNRPAGGAYSLRFDSILVTDTHSDQLCDVDTVHLVDRSSHINTGFVSLGKFVLYAKPR